MTRPVLAGVGTASPGLSISQKRASELTRRYGPRTPEEERIHRILYRRTGVRARGSVVLEGPPEATRPGGLFPAPDGAETEGPGTRARMEVYEREAPRLALGAATVALRDAGVDGGRISHLVVVTCTGFTAPGLDTFLVKQLGLPETTARIQVGFMGCHGAFIGLRTAAALAATDPAAAVLVVAVELCSLHFQYGWNPEQIVANALFADGAGAAVVTYRGAGRAGALELAAHGSWLAPDCEPAMTWRVGDHGFQMTLSAQVPKLIRDGLRGQVEPWLARQGLQLGDVASWAVHPGGPRILTAAAQALDLPPDTLAVSREVLAEHGNMSSPTILFILRRLVDAEAPRPWVALAFGPGLTTEALLLR